MAGAPPRLATDRLVLRGWRAGDRPVFAAMNADPQVMEHFPAPLSRTESDTLLDRITAEFVEHGFGLWAVEVRGGAEPVGFVGLSVPGFSAPFTPCVEIGWRLARHAWGHGYATEAATAALDHGFRTVGLDEVVSFTAEVNTRSQGVMQRLGMVRDPSGDFLHPRLPPDHRLAPHVLYRISADHWATRL